MAWKKHCKAVEVNIADLDARYKLGIFKYKEDETLTKALKKKTKRPESNDEFLPIQIGDGLDEPMHISADIPDDVREGLIDCLQQRTNLFSWSADDMSSISLNISCHQLAVDPKEKRVAQRRRTQSKKKVKVFAKAVENLIEVDFVKEVQYTTWLSNAVLVIKSNGKWRMCNDFN